MGLLDALYDPTFRADVKKNARNLAQSASNTLAENVSAPVDVINWLLHQGGVNIQDPVMGANWLRQYGLTAPVEKSPSSVAGETLGLLAPLGLVNQNKLKGLLSP